MHQIPLDDGLHDILRRLGEPVDQIARELMVCELFRRGAISRGRAAELLGVGYVDFLNLASKLQIPLIDLTPDELKREVQAARSACPPTSLSPTPAH